MRIVSAIALVLALLPAGAASAQIVPTFIRGDVTMGGAVNEQDVSLWEWCYRTGNWQCKDSGDVDDNGVIQITDLVVLAGYVYQGGPPPSYPFPFCNPDPTPDGLSCDDTGNCPSE